MESVPTREGVRQPQSVGTLEFVGHPD